MKKLLCILLSVSLLALPMSASVLADDLNATPPSVSQGEDMGFLPGTVPADSALTDGISLPLSALALSMLEGGLTYDTNSSFFVWNALYYVLSLYGHEDDRAEVTEQALLLPSECVQDFFSALFGRCTELPAIPDELAHRVGYDPAEDRYSLALGDMALVDVNLTAPVPAEEGLFSLNGILTVPDTGAPVCSFRTLLEANDTMFGFSVVDFVFS